MSIGGKAAYRNGNQGEWTVLSYGACKTFPVSSQSTSSVYFLMMIRSCSGVAARRSFDLQLVTSKTSPFTFFT